jgi:uncharacterized protein YacL
MPVLVSDTSVLIDLERSELLQCAFELEDDLVVPDLLYERELRDHGGEQLRSLGLRIESLSPEGIEQAQRYLQRDARLTVPDCFALTLAQQQGWILLTGDGALRAMATVEGVACHGVLWFVDLLEQASVATHAQLRDGLQRLAAHPRCRLPKEELITRLERYVQLIAGA